MWGENRAFKQARREELKNRQIDHTVEHILTKFVPKMDAPLSGANLVNAITFPEEMGRFSKLTLSVHSSHKEERYEALKDLETDQSMMWLAPLFIEFFRRSIRLKTMKEVISPSYGVYMIRSLLENPYLQVRMKPHVHKVMSPLLSCVLSSWKGDGKRIKSHRCMQNLSANIIASIVKSYDSRGDIKVRVIKEYLKPITKPFIPMRVLCGAVKGLVLLGEEIVEQYLVPNLEKIDFKLRIRQRTIRDDPKKIRELSRFKNFLADSVLLTFLKDDSLKDDLLYKVNTDEDGSYWIVKLLIQAQIDRRNNLG